MWNVWVWNDYQHASIAFLFPLIMITPYCHAQVKCNWKLFIFQIWLILIFLDVKRVIPSFATEFTSAWLLPPSPPTNTQTHSYIYHVCITLLELVFVHLFFSLALAIFDLHLDSSRRMIGSTPKSRQWPAHQLLFAKTTKNLLPSKNPILSV